MVADLEEHLGTRLLQRTTRRLSLTDAGRTYLNRVRNILQDIDEAEAITSSQTHELAGVLRVHAPPVLASYVIGPLLGKFHQSYPNILLDIEVETIKDSPFEDFDITLLGTEANFNADVVARKVIESETILVASPGYLKRRGVPQTPENLVLHSCLKLKTPTSRPRYWHMWRTEKPKQVIEVEIAPVLLANHTDTLLRATLDDGGITSVSLDVAAPYLTRGQLVRVLSPWVTGRVAMYAALPSRKFIPQRTHVFLDYLVEETRRQIAKAIKACTVTGDQ
ncbi:MAG TPA: LysR substrate-binding domain-containing protein [Eoetvoesiella sp.]